MKNSYIFYCDKPAIREALVVACTRIGFDIVDLQLDQYRLVAKEKIFLFLTRRTSLYIRIGQFEQSKIYIKLDNKKIYSAQPERSWYLHLKKLCDEVRLIIDGGALLKTQSMPSATMREMMAKITPMVAAEDRPSPDVFAPRSVRKLLIIGFSCTAVRDGFAYVIKRSLATENNLEVYLCGLGGLNPAVIPTAFDSVTKLHGPFTHVVLEIATSIYSYITRDSEDQARQLAVDILHRIAQSGARPAILLLFRVETRPLVVNWNRILTETATLYGYPVVDLAEGLVARRGEEFARSLIRDVVHTTPEGSKYQAEETLTALNDWLTTQEPAAIPERLWMRRSCINLADFATETGVLRKQDYEFRYARVAAGETVTAEFDKPIRVLGFTFGYGPCTGDLIIRIDDGEPFLVPAFDARSYYERLGMRALGPAEGRLVRKFSVTQDAAMPSVKLQKGEPDPGPREGRIMDLLTFERTSEARREAKPAGVREPSSGQAL